MVYTTRRRNQFRVVVSGMTGVLTVTAVTATGWLAGRAAADDAEERTEADLAAQAAEARAASDYARQQQEYADALAAAEPRRVVVKQRPQRTRTTVRYVQATGGYSGTGGSVSSSGGSGTSVSSSGSGGGGGGTTSSPVTPPPPPPPPPPPVSSSGS
jgi:hypothetical protein